MEQEKTFYEELVEACMTLVEGLKETAKQEVDLNSLSVQELIELAGSEKRARIDLSNRRLSEIPKEIFTLPQLKELNLIESRPIIRVFNNLLPIYSKVIHDNPDDLFDLILTNQHQVNLVNFLSD